MKTIINILKAIVGCVMAYMTTGMITILCFSIKKLFIGNIFFVIPAAVFFAFAFVMAWVIGEAIINYGKENQDEKQTERGLK